MTRNTLAVLLTALVDVGCGALCVYLARQPMDVRAAAALWVACVLFFGLAALLVGSLFRGRP